MVGNTAWHVVTLDASTNRISVNALTGAAMTIGATPLASTNKTINEATEYTVTVVKRQGTIRAWVDQDSASIVTYSSSTINDFDSFGLISEVTNAKFDGERSERERAAIGKADRDVRGRPATCP